MADYDIGDALLRIEDILLKSMGRNLHRHLGEEEDEERRWTMWQAEQLTGLHQWSTRNLKRCAPAFRRINDAAAELLREANRQGELDEEERLLADGVQQAAEFFHPPGDRFDALLKAVRSDLSRAEHSLLRQADDTYRRALFDAHTYLQTGAGDLNRAIDMAVGDLSERGIRSVLYRNGRRVEASAYARMALRSASVRARLMGEGKARDSMGIHTVIVPPSGIACAKCAVWMGRVLVDDVYSSGTAQEATELGVPLLSAAVGQGFLHPQCNCMPVTYRPGISRPPEPVTDEERENAVKRYKLTQKQRYNERQIRKWKQKAEDAPDEQTRNICKARVRSWQQANKRLCDENPDFLRRDYSREKIYDFPDKPILPNVIDKTPPEPSVNAETREKPTTVSETMAAPEQTPEPLVPNLPEGDKAASPNDPKAMEEVPPTPHSREELDDLVAYAAERDLNLVEVERFDGDLELAKEQLDVMAKIKQEYKLTKKLSVKFKPMHGGDLGFTPTGAKSVELNLYAFRSRAVTNAYLNADDWFSSSDTVGIGVHEMGHVISAKYGEKGLDIARQAYYNIYNREITYQDLVKFLLGHISNYCAFLREENAQKPFSVKLFKEITPEILAKNKTNPDAFTQEFTRLLKEVQDQ